MYVCGCVYVFSFSLQQRTSPAAKGKQVWQQKNRIRIEKRKGAHKSNELWRNATGRFDVPHFVAATAMCAFPPFMCMCMCVCCNEALLCRSLCLCLSTSLFLGLTFFFLRTKRVNVRALLIAYLCTQLLTRGSNFL